VNVNQIFNSRDRRSTLTVAVKESTVRGRHIITVTHDYQGRGDGPVQGYDLGADERDALVALLKSVPMG
jgi:hypothetical protein